MEVAVELALAEDRIDVLRDAKEIQVCVRISAALGERVRKLPPARCETAQLPARLLRPVAEVCAGAEERHHLRVHEELGNQPVVAVVGPHRLGVALSRARAAYDPTFAQMA
jgi:hypothetical protein